MIDITKDLTVIIPTSPIPTHPSTYIIERCLYGISNILGLKKCQKYIVCDNCPSLKSEWTYDEYKRRLRSLHELHPDFTQTRLLFLPEHFGLPGALLAALHCIKTRYLLVFQHDFEAIRTVDVEGVLRMLSVPDVGIKHVRLNHRRNIPHGWDTILSPMEDLGITVPLTRTSAWSDQPHFTTVAYYQSTVVPHIRRSRSSKGVETVIHPMYQAEIRKRGFKVAHNRYGTCLYDVVGAEPTVRNWNGRKTLDLPNNQSTNSAVSPPSKRLIDQNMAFPHTFNARAINRLTAKMARPNTYRPAELPGYGLDDEELNLLKHVITMTGAKRILEFGPGRSTDVFATSGCIVTSLEADYEYYRIAKEKNQYPDVKICYYKAGYPIETELRPQHYDMAFVDGPRGMNYPFCSRLDSVQYAMQYTNAILLHDTNREGERNTVRYLQQLGWRSQVLSGSKRGMTLMLR